MPRAPRVAGGVVVNRGMQVAIHVIPPVVADHAVDRAETPTAGPTFPAV